jgi:hypothetical protein
VWNQRKESEFKTIKEYLEKYKNSGVILDIGGVMVFGRENN